MCVLAVCALIPVGCGTGDASNAYTGSDAGDDSAVAQGDTGSATGPTNGDAGTGADSMAPPMQSDAGSPGPGADASDGGTDAPAGPSVSTVFSMDTPNVVRRSNIVLGKANTRPEQLMALGNGSLGAAVWAANGFTAQLNRTDTFPDRKSPGWVTIPGLAALTGASDFHGTVDLYDAMLNESGGGMTATAFVRADAPELVVDVTGADPNSMQSVKVNLWNGRSPMAQAAGSTALLAETWQDNSGVGNSGQTFGTLAAVTVAGQNVSAQMVDGVTVQVNFKPNSDGSFRVVVASPTWTGGDAMSAATKALGSDATADAMQLRAGHLSFWHDYWDRIGLVEMNSSDGTADYLEAVRTIYLYTTAAEMRGTLPGSNVGLADLFDFIQDTQMPPFWPAGYWVWNSRMLVYANMTSGAFDMNTPEFNLYQSNLMALESWTMSSMSGKPGICLPETMRFNGNGTWFGGTGGGSCNESASPGYNALTVSSGAEVGLWVWHQYLMTQDQSFLMTNYPLMSQAATFLLNYATTGADGRLHTNANAHETQWAVNDPTTDIVAMKALFPATIAAAGVLGVDAPLVAQLKDAITKVPDLPRTDPGSHMQLLSASDDAAGQDVYAISYQPNAPLHNTENLDLEGVWPYSLIGDTDPNLPLAVRTFKSRMYVLNPDWSYDAIQAARLGLSAEVANALKTVTQNYQSFINGLGLWKGGTNSGTMTPFIEQAGVLAAAINEAFVQDYDGLLRIVPAWPQGWDGAGTVFVQGKSKVDVQVKGGQVVLVVVEAGSTGMMQVRNPWSGQALEAIDGTTGAVAVPSTSSATFMLPTSAGHWYALVPAGAASSLPKVVVTGMPATAAKHLGPVSIGL